MPVLVIAKLRGRRDYELISSELIRRGFGFTPVLSHVAAPTDDAFLIVDLWPSEAAWNEFARTALQPAVQALGLADAFSVKLYRPYNLGWPGKFAGAEEHHAP